MTEKEINRIYIRSRLRYVMQDCLISDELIAEVRRMLIEIYDTGLKNGEEINKLKLHNKCVIL